MFSDRLTPWGPVGTARSAFDDILKTLQTPLQVRTPKGEAGRATRCHGGVAGLHLCTSGDFVYLSVVMQLKYPAIECMYIGAQWPHNQLMPA